MTVGHAVLVALDAVWAERCGTAIAFTQAFAAKRTMAVGAFTYAVVADVPPALCALV